MTQTKTTLEYFHRFPRLPVVLKIIHHHLVEKDYDFPLIIVGDTGNGKSMLALHIYELWMKLFQKKSLNIKDISVDRFAWVKNFEHMEKGDCNIFDEGVTGLYSKESMNKFARTLEKLYQVFRKKNFFSVILIPDFFMITKFFRDHRARGLIWVDKRGQFKYYSKRAIGYINSYNENRLHKRLNCTAPTFTGSFCDYRGELRDDYDSMAQASVNKIISEVKAELDPNQTQKKENHKHEWVRQMKATGDYTMEQIAKATGYTRDNVYKILRQDV